MVQKINKKIAKIPFLLFIVFFLLLTPLNFTLNAAELGGECCAQSECPSGTECINSSCSYETIGGGMRAIGTKGKCLSPLGGPCKSGSDCIIPTGQRVSCVLKSETSSEKICKILDTPPTEKQPRLAIPDIKLNVPFGELEEQLSGPKTITENGKTFLVVPWLALYIGEIYKYALGIVSIAAVLMIMVAGIIWLTAGGSAEKVTTAKNYISGAIIGLLLALLSYLILYTVNPALVKFEPIKVQLIHREETEIVQNTGNNLCNNPNNPQKFSNDAECRSSTPCSSSSSSNDCIQDGKEWCCACEDCQVMLSTIPRKEGIKGYKLSAGLITKLQNMTTCSENWVVTEAYPPDVEHISRGHYNGKAVDIALRPIITSSLEERTEEEKKRITALIQCAQNAGFDKIVNEYEIKYKTTTGNHLHLE